MRAVIISIGDELVLGQTVDTNSAYLSAQLARLGVATQYHQTVADDQAAIAKSIRVAAGSAPLVLISGGLGPTDDDLTRQAMADAMGTDLVLHEPSIEVIRRFFARGGREIPDRNKIQAMHPRGSQVIANSCGTAPGIKAKIGQAMIYVTPGVPIELVAMFEQSILPDLAAKFGNQRSILTCTINTFGAGESSVAEQLGDLARRDRNPLVGTTVSNGFVAVRIRSEFADADEAQRRLEETAERIEHRLGAIVFGRDEQTIQRSLAKLLQQRGASVATAESCTGGLVGKIITDMPGSSDVYAGGWVTYNNRMKVEQLGVDEALIAEHGAVSASVARAMAQGAAGRSGADLAIAVTGIAGPGGGSEEKPVGTVWIAIAWRDPSQRDAFQTDAVLLDLAGDREKIRDRAAKSAIQLLRLHLMGQTDQLTFGRRAASAQTR